MLTKEYTISLLSAYIPTVAVVRKSHKRKLVAYKCFWYGKCFFLSFVFFQIIKITSVNVTT